jgi:hypothetical protein
MDYFVILDSIHRLLQHTPLETLNNDGKTCLAKPFARYWQTVMWNRVFEMLLEADGPAASAARKELEACLVKNMTWRRLVRLALCRLESALGFQ